MTETEIVVVIHGLWMNGAEASLLRHRLTSEHGYPTVLFQYGTFEAGFGANADRLRDFLDTLDATRIHLVGHSTGGLMALVALDRRPLALPGRVVCLGSPLRGSVAAERLAQLGDLAAAVLGQTGREALLGQVLTEYRGNREVGVIAGTTSVGAGMFLGVLPEPNDGTIAVEETRLPGIRDHLTYPVTHTGLLVSPEVASQTAFFLRHGMFNRQSPAYRSAQ
ncbi:MAG: alpha/beta hydrolase [Gammaproteobacteria bacterium]|nr:alpha/beta hydrolase [Gammaproteobacteria bacterium]